MDSRGMVRIIGQVPDDLRAAIRAGQSEKTIHGIMRKQKRGGTVRAVLA